jgi:excisionase family DNA binding protein
MLDGGKKMNNQELLQKIEDRLKKSTVCEKPLTAKEAAKFLDLSLSMIYKLTHKKEITFSKPHGKRIFFNKADLVEWMLKNPVKTRSQLEDEAANHVANKL